MNNTTTDFPSSSRQENFDNFQPRIIAGDGGAGTSGSQEIIRKKKRKKMCRVAAVANPNDSPLRHPRPWKKPDSNVPKIARPCSECGKQFSSWKALFGHMRCHPERTWRGINPPINSRRPLEIPSENFSANFTEEDHEVATCLVLLSNGPFVTALDSPSSVIGGSRDCHEALVSADCRFECSSCKRVFGSHQALGGHRASHKNVKGCFAIARTDGEDECQIGDHGHDRSGEGDQLVLGHQSRICMRVFSSGQDLGGQRSCQWEKGLKELSSPQGLNLNPSIKREECGDLDLNSPAPLENNGSSSSTSSSSSGLVLDLRLGI